MIGYLPIAAAARFIGRSPRWLRRRLNQIPHYRPPEGQLLFKAADLESYLDQFRVEPTRPAKVDLDEILADVAPRRRGRQRIEAGQRR